MAKKEEKKAIKTISGMEGVSWTLGALVNQPTGHRDDVFNDKVEGQTIDTCMAPDTGVWETGIERDHWIIVEQYHTRDEAEKGHKEWVKKLTKKPKMKLKDIMVWDF